MKGKIPKYMENPKLGGNRPKIGSDAQMGAKRPKIKGRGDLKL